MLCRIFRYILAISLLLAANTLFAAKNNIVNVFTWSEELPTAVITEFEHETGIRVNYSTFDSNEIMFAKLRANKNSGYDLIEPSSYYIDRMRHQGLLEKLDRQKLPNFVNLDPAFLNLAYDPHSEYSVPFICLYCQRQ